MATPQPATGIFPPALEQVNLSEQVAESFGWLPGYAGVICSISCVFALVESPGLRRGDVFSIAFTAGLGVLSGLLLWWEFRRRARRTVMVPRGGVVGIYRNHQFAEAMAPTQMRFYKLHPFNTLRTVIVPAFVGVMLLGMPFFAKNGSPGDRWTLPALGAIILIGSASGIRTRMMLEHWYIPKGRRSEEVMLGKAEVRRVLSGQ